MNRLFLLLALAATLASGAHAQTAAWINEIHYDNTGNDVNEFVEVVLPAGLPSTAYTLVLYNGTGSAGPPVIPAGTPYGTARTIDTCTLGTSYDVNADAVNDLTFYSCVFAANGLQNGGNAAQPASDGLALVGPDPLNPAYPLVQYLSYEGTQGAASGPAQGQISQDVGVTEAGADPIGGSLNLTGTSAAYEGFTWALGTDDTPGARNVGQTLSLTNIQPAFVPFGDGDDDLAGYRQLAIPLAGMRVNDLATVNLVQGVPGSAPFAAQYPDAGDNLFTAYTEATGFTPPVNTAQGMQLGRGFFWYLYDQTINPDDNASGGGTSNSVALPQTAVFAGVPAPGNAAATPDLRVTFSANASGAYLLGNPRNGPFLLSGVSALTSATTTSTPTTVQANFQVFDPSSGSYVIRGAAESVSVGQGFWAEMTTVDVATPVRTFGYDVDAVGTATELIGKTAASRVALALDGQLALASGAVAVSDRAALVDFSAEATTGWDTGDLSKLTPPGSAYALVAVVGERDGAAVRQAVRSLPATEAATALDVAFTATHAGTFELSAAAAPAGWSVVVTDRVSGATADLVAGPYAFAAAAGDWTDRFAIAVTPARSTASEGGAASVSLGSAFPNPAASQATLALRVDAAQTVTAVVVDALGRTVATVFEGALAAGAEQMLVVPTQRLAPGVYVVRVTGETFAQSRRLVVAR